MNESETTLTSVPGAGRTADRDSDPSQNPSPAAGMRVGESASIQMQVTEEMIRAFAAFSGDDNRLHVDGQAARELGFPHPVAHGMIALGMISRLIGTKLPGHGSLWMSQDVRFVQPVFAGDVLTARVTVEKASQAAQVVVLKTEVFRGSPPAAVLTGTAQVRLGVARSAVQT